MTKTEKIAQYLAEGLTPAKVSDIIGCTPGLISQLQKDERFIALLDTKKSEIAANPKTEDEEITFKYHALEHKLIGQMDRASNMAELPAITAALKVVAERQDRRAQRLATPNQPASVQNIINISLPAHAIPEIHLNSQREVIAIGSKPLASLSSAGVKNLFDNIAAAKQDKHEVVGEF